MAAEMTASDFALWRAFYADLPDRTEFYLSQICYLICAAAGIKRNDGTPFASRAEFAPDLSTPQERMEAMRAYAETEASFREMQQDARAKAQTRANGAA